MLIPSRLAPHVVITTFLLASLPLEGQLTGRYTVDPWGSGSRNFPDLITALGALGAGVAGPVTFEVKAATYRGALTLTRVTGASSLNTVTFVTRGTTPATIDAQGASAGVLGFSATHYRLENFRVQNAKHRAIHLLGGGPFNPTSFNTFVRCDFDAPASPFLSIGAGHLVNAHDNAFIRCRFAGGGQTLFNNASKRCLFDGCTFDGKRSAAYVIHNMNTNDGDNVWQNCVIHGSGPTGRAVYFPSFGGGGDMMWHNTIVVNTSVPAVAVGSCCTWSRAGSFRNNIVVNLGPAPAIEYAEGSAGLVPYDYDYNSYHAPHSKVGTVTTTRRSFSGTLAGWKHFFKTAAIPVPKGGGNSWDPNSLETDPGLVSLTRPYDFHLQPRSPLVDRGTKRLIEGWWVTFDPNAKVARDVDGAPRGARVDIGADEVGARLLASGLPRPGGTVVFSLESTSVGRPYQVGSAFRQGAIPIGGRSIPLGIDNLLVITVLGAAPAVFQGYQGVLDTSGRARAEVRIPNRAALKGIRFFTAFITLDSAAPKGIAEISGAVVVSIV